jgi:putative acetyltransferase
MHSPSIDRSLLIRQSNPDDGPSLVAIWRSAVLATHEFLTQSDFDQIERWVEEFLPRSKLWIAEINGRAVGFMGLEGISIDSLFIDAECHRMGIGRALVEFAAQFSPTLTVDVNEQNGGAVAFYRNLGFVVVGRSPTDGQGLPYPLLHMLFEAD